MITYPKLVLKIVKVYDDKLSAYISKSRDNAIWIIDCGLYASMGKNITALPRNNSRLGTRKTGLSTPPPQYFNTDRSKAVLLLWFLTVTCSCCPYLYFGSAIMLVAYFSKV